MSDFRSDTVTLPTPAMKQAMMDAPLGDDVMGEDPTVNLLQETAAAMLGFEAALFAPSGTQTNLIAMMTHCQRGEEAIVGQQWHTNRWEAGGMAVLGSIQPQPLEHQPDGTIALNDIEAAIKPDDPHFARTRLVVAENTFGGRVPDCAGASPRIRRKPISSSPTSIPISPTISSPTSTPAISR